MRVYAGKDTYAAGRLVQQWRKPTNPISKRKLLTKDLALDTFHIGVDDVNKCVIETIQLIKDAKNFAILMPVSVTSEIARLENVEGERCFDKEMAIKVSAMSKVTLASSSEVWLINLLVEPFNHFLNNDMEGLGLTGCQAVFQDSLARERETSGIMQDYDDNIVAEEQFKQSDIRPKGIRSERRMHGGSLSYNKIKESLRHAHIISSGKYNHNWRATQQ